MTSTRFSTPVRLRGRTRGSTRPKHQLAAQQSHRAQPAAKNHRTLTRTGIKASPSINGVTLVETLIVVAIISLLLQLALPAVEMARESARATSCRNNMRQIGLASQLHLSAQGHFPTGGWTSVWVGDPSRGFSKNQPGGWCYNLLPYMEQQELHDMGLGKSDEDRRQAAAQMFSTPLESLVCPSRRLARPYSFNRALFNSIKPATAGRSDYAANTGSLEPKDQRGPGPRTYDEAAQWAIGTDRLSTWVGWEHNGIVYQRSTVQPRSVTDGLSTTYFAGEKFLAPRYYLNGKSDGDDQGICIGFDRDTARSTNLLHPPLLDNELESAWLPSGDSRSVITWNFGSAHPECMNMINCDASVVQINYDIDISVFSAKGSRNGEESQ
jgi:type II secretory pathway pseudopilin PulG